jgi:8-oxo-dGTP diphosphatase
MAAAPKTPVVAVDIIIELLDRPGRPIVLIERKHEPLGWALPGGFVEIGECVEEAAVREAAEETNLEITLSTLLGVYSDPDRDPRGHSVSAVYVATSAGAPVAMDDAAAVRVFDLDRLPTQLAFDHAEILDDYRTFRSSGERPPPHPVELTRPIA